mmetsp:Transcript_7570/g.19223  ORF Transcript_7570/g.19223 Transcript_7570/m.19223 type:complete len:219 (+) Transcript_7570:748-1404(+)
MHKVDYGELLVGFRHEHCNLCPRLAEGQNRVGNRLGCRDRCCRDRCCHGRCRYSSSYCGTCCRERRCNRACGRLGRRRRHLGRRRRWCRHRRRHLRWLRRRCPRCCRRLIVRSNPADLLTPRRSKIHAGVGRCLLRLLCCDRFVVPSNPVVLLILCRGKSRAGIGGRVLRLVVVGRGTTVVRGSFVRLRRRGLAGLARRIRRFSRPSNLCGQDHRRGP